MAMDHCRAAKRLSAAEIAVFKTAATCVGSAIYQESVRRDRAAQERAKLLGSVAEVANLLLGAADCSSVLDDVVRLLGEATGSDRCGVLMDIGDLDTGKSAVKLLAEWESEEAPVSSISDTGFNVFANNQIILEGAFLGFHQPFLRGEAANFNVAELSNPIREFFEAQGNTSMLIVPIMVQGKCWGQIGFDNCGEPRLYDESEIAILKWQRIALPGRFLVRPKMKPCDSQNKPFYKSGNRRRRSDRVCWAVCRSSQLTAECG